VPVIGIGIKRNSGNDEPLRTMLVAYASGEIIGAIL
jgi:hypothetical protein